MGVECHIRHPRYLDVLLGCELGLSVVLVVGVGALAVFLVGPLRRLPLLILSANAWFYRLVGLGLLLCGADIRLVCISLPKPPRSLRLRSRSLSFLRSRSFRCRSRLIHVSGRYCRLGSTSLRGLLCHRGCFGLSRSSHRIVF